MSPSLHLAVGRQQAALDRIDDFQATMGVSRNLAAEFLTFNGLGYRSEPSIPAFSGPRNSATLNMRGPFWGPYKRSIVCWGPFEESWFMETSTSTDDRNV